MISFIIIGKNEGWKLTKCFQSINETVEYNHLHDYEIIYVDSNSIDDSIERAKKFSYIRIFKITGKCNAAIGRNIGAKESHGDSLCFLDADMEIVPEFLANVYSERNGLFLPFVSGKVINYYYDQEWNLVSKEDKISAEADKYEFVTGGFFLIKREIWFSVNGMRNIFVNGQDLDLGLRLKWKFGISNLRKKEVAAIHHTIDYLDKNRMWKDLKKGIPLYYRSLLYRKHLFNPYIFPRIFRSDYTLILLLLSLFFFIFQHNFFPLGLYVLLIFIKSLKISKKKFNSKINQFFYYIIRDFMILFGFFLFFPKEVKMVQYSKVL